MYVYMCLYMYVSCTDMGRHAHKCTVMHRHAQTLTDMHRHAQSCAYIDSSRSINIDIILIVLDLGTIDLFFIGGVFLCVFVGV